VSARKPVPFCVFFGTRVALVLATSKRAAFDAFIKKAFPVKGEQGQGAGRLMPPVRSEVNIRPLAQSDAGWIDEFDGKDANAFRKALASVK
jgi:hypothetical protein